MPGRGSTYEVARLHPGDLLSSPMEKLLGRPAQARIATT